MGLFSRKKNQDKAPDKAPVVVGYDYATQEKREETAQALFLRAKNARTVKEAEWERFNNYYNFIHDATAELQSYCEENDLPWYPATVPDPWIMVESQVDPNVPEPEFHGRDDDQDSAKAKRREFVVRYICENNRLGDMNTKNEKRLIKLGDAFWKGYWDSEMRCGISEGDIRIKDIPVQAIYIDPSVREGDIQDGQFVDYVYRLHRVRFAQLYGKSLRKQGFEPSEIVSTHYIGREDLFDMTTALDEYDDTMEILEHWFRWPEDTRIDGLEIPAGAVGCSIQAGGHEVKLIPLYWENTYRQCKLFPFVHYWRVVDENEFYNKSELFSILDLVDAADRKLASTLLNDAFMANDIVLVDELALADGEEFVNEPGAVIRTKQNGSEKIHRLGGLQSAGSNTQFITYLTEQIQRTNRNFETNQGKETTRQTTATGLAMLRSDADEQEDIKKSDRTKGFERLYELLDWLALEFFDDDRLIYLGAKKDVRENPVSFVFNSQAYTREMPAVTDAEGNVVRESWTYWPKVDVTVTAGDSVVKSKQATLNALSQLTAANVTADNWKLYAAMLEILDIPQRQDIVDAWERKFGPGVPPEVTDALAQNPELLSVVEAIIGAQGAQAPQKAEIPPAQSGPRLLPGGPAMGLPAGSGDQEAAL